MSPEEINLAAMAETLVKSPDYRCCAGSRVELNSLDARGQVTKTGILLDVETTGLDTARDEVIELAIVRFTYLPDDQIARITDVLVPAPLQWCFELISTHGF